MRLESSLNGNLGTLFRNHQQLKNGLDAAEVNQRAMVKVVTDLTKTTFGFAPSVPEHCVRTCCMRLLKDETVDWGAYYRAAEDDVEAEKIAAYRTEVAKLNEKVTAMEADLPFFEDSLKEELEKAGVVNPKHPRAQAVERFLNDLKKEIAKVRTADKIIASSEWPDKAKVEEFNTRILSDAAFMIAKAKSKKSKEEAAPEEAPKDEASADEPNETTTVFGG